MTPHSWFKPRRYRHFDMPVGRKFASKVQSRNFISTHSFSPFLHFVKETKRFKPVILASGKRGSEGTVKKKIRDIMYASHRDACIFSYYSYLLNIELEKQYEVRGIGEFVIAYRSIGRSNSHFSFEALQFAIEHEPCMILGFDISGFFDNLDHKLLKHQLKSILQVGELSADWYAVFKNITRFRFIKSAILRSHPDFISRFDSGEHGMIASMSEMTSKKVPIEKNIKAKGIPQGSPISATLANLYMIQLDEDVGKTVQELGGFYRRYSDDIMIVCNVNLSRFAEDLVHAAVTSLALSINDDKTDRSVFDPSSKDVAQYLGFSYHRSKAVIRSSSMARQWRKLRRSFKRTQAAGLLAIKNGTAEKIYTKKLRRRFASLAPRRDQPLRNFSSYARRSAGVFGSKHILGQVRRLERELEELTQLLKKHSTTAPGSSTP